MESKKKNILAIVFVAFIALVIIFLSVCVYSTPVDVVSGTAGNFSVNLVNGGKVLDDEGFIFFTYPDKKGIWRAEYNGNEKTTQISKDGDGFLQVYGNEYFYSDNNRLYRCDWAAENKQKVIDYAEKPLVVGSLVFYLDKDGSLIKYSIQNSNKTVVKSADDEHSVKEFVVYYQKIYYTDKNGDIRKMSFDGSKDELFVETNAQKLSVDGHYFFYTVDGVLNSCMLKDNQLLKTEITNVQEYAIYGSYIIYTDKNKTFYADVNKILTQKDYKPQVVSETKSTGLSIGEESFYYFSNGEFFKMSHDGKNIIKIK